ncbi:MAG TPA: DUF1003 domain-containing protein [Fimbriimonas sp.]|nr:DUF1003 domain-containing protein [Fimbriimonas sp.]
MASTDAGPRTVLCQICMLEVPIDEAVPADLIRESILPLLQTKANPWDPQGYVSLTEVNKARLEHVHNLLEHVDVDTQRLNQEVIRSVQEHELLAKNVDKEFDKNQSFGERAADRIAAFGGSWKFIGIFSAVLFCWMAGNTALIFRGGAKPPDPFPYIFLNLVLSCLAAIQAPVIMMSQNRQEERDRMRGDNDYKVNLKAEVEIRALNEKVDKLLNDQWKHLMEIQQMQVEMIQQMTRANLE